MAKETFKALRDNLASEAKLVITLLDATGGNAPVGFQAGMQDFARQAWDLEAFIARVETDAIPVRIAVVGDFSSGKSSFINSVLQDPGLCPVGLPPTTSLVTTFTYDSEERILQHHSDGRATAVSRAHYAALVQAPQDASTPMHFTFRLPHPLLKGLELVDTPGFNNPANPADSQVTSGIMKDADAFFYLMDANTGSISKTGLEQVRQIKRESNEAQVFLLISKADGKWPPDLERIKAQHRKEHAELFHDRILTYSSIEARPDLDSREDLAELFQAFQRDKAMLAKGTLKRRLRAHQDLRLTRARHLQETLLQLAERLEEDIQNREAILTKSTKRLREVQEGERLHFGQELAHAVYTCIFPTVEPKSGWIWQSAKIFFSTTPFKDKIEECNSFNTLKEALHDILVALFGNARQDLHEGIEKHCQEAKRNCARIAEASTRSLWQSDLNHLFDDFDGAAKRYNAVYDERALATAEAVWAEWMLCCDGLYDDFKFLSAPSEAMNRRRETLTAGIEQWKYLIETMPEPKP